MQGLTTFEHDREVVTAADIVIDLPFIVHIAYRIAKSLINGLVGTNNWVQV